jgi:PAS domain S-box-containing protein
MSDNEIIFSGKDFRNLFPFYIQIGRDGTILSAGDSLQKIVPLKKGDRLQQWFNIHRPYLPNATFQDIEANTNLLFILDSTTSPIVKLRGQWYQPEGSTSLVFLGSPWFDSMHSVNDFGLAINDFAIHDPIVDLLHVLKTNEIGMNDLREVLAKYKLQQNKLRQLSLIATETINSIIITNKNGEIEWVNKAFEKVTEYSLEEVKGKRPGSFLQGPLSDRNTIRYLSTQIKNGRDFTCELVNYTKSGKPYWIRINGQPLFDNNGNIEQYFAIEEDITEQKEAVLKLSWSEEKYRGIIENMDLGLVEFDNEDQVLFCNNSFSRMTGYELSFLSGKLLPEVLKERNPNFEPSYRVKRRHGGITDVYEIEITDSKGETKWLLVSKALLYDTQRRITGSIGIHLDITWRKRLELQLKRSREEAEESSKAKESFLVNMSHEIRTPMNVILGMSRHLSGLINEKKQRDLLQSITAATDNLLVIINDVLDISKIEAGKLEIEKVGFRPRKFMDEAKKILSFKAEEKGITFSCDVAEEIPEVLLGDPYRLNQILLNLGGNAVKFTEQGTVDCNVFMQRTTGGEVQLRFIIEDTGIGIDQDKLEDVFDSFQQESNSISRQYGGSGLGLTISRELTRLMGGTLRLESQKGIGTRVLLDLPFKVGTEKDVEITSDETEKLGQLNNVKILVVEDNLMNQHLAQSVLESYGAKAIGADNGNEALLQLSKESFDLVLMDLRMPGMGGIETTQLMRDRLKLKTPVIALTANTRSELKHDLERVGINDYLLKPYQEGSLIRKIMKHLGRTSIITDQPIARAVKDSGKIYDTRKLEAFTVKNPDFLKRMLQLFIEEMTAGFIDLKAALAEKDYIKIGDLAHRMKPGVDQLMITDLYEGVKAIEQLGKKQDPNGELPALVEEMENLLHTAIVQIKANEF